MGCLEVKFLVEVTNGRMIWRREELVVVSDLLNNLQLVAYDQSEGLTKRNQFFTTCRNPAQRDFVLLQKNAENELQVQRDPGACTMPFRFCLSCFIAKLIILGWLSSVNVSRVPFLLL